MTDVRLSPFSPAWKSEMLPSPLLLTTRLSSPFPGKGTAMADVGSMPPLESVCGGGGAGSETGDQRQVVGARIDGHQVEAAAGGEVAEQKLSRIRTDRKDGRGLIVEEAVAEPLQQQNLVGAAIGDQEIGHALARAAS